jgi:hypothetical protein
MGIHKLSDQIIEYAERMSDVADAAQGKRIRTRTARRWLLLPAVGAGLLAVVRSDSFTRQAKGVVDEAKSRASDLPDDLMSRVRQTTQATSSSSNGRSSKRRTTRKPRATSKSGAR